MAMMQPLLEENDWITMSSHDAEHCEQIQVQFDTMHEERKWHQFEQTE